MGLVDVTANAPRCCSAENAGIRLRPTVPSGADELGNYIQAEPVFRSSRLRKSCLVTPSFACIEPRCVRSEHADAARTAGPAASPPDDLEELARRGRWRLQTPLAEVAR